MDILSNFGLRRPAEKFNLDQRQDLPLYKQPGTVDNYKERVGVEMKGVRNGTVIHNKSDYTQRGEK